jgi:hypothetical protein
MIMVVVVLVVLVVVVMMLMMLMMMMMTLLLLLLLMTMTVIVMVKMMMMMMMMVVWVAPYALRNFQGGCALRITAANVTCHALPVGDSEQLLHPLAAQAEHEQLACLFERRVKLARFEGDVPAGRMFYNRLRGKASVEAVAGSG